MKSELLQFLNTHPDDWQKIIAVAPYSCIVKHDEPYWLIKYTQNISDFSLPFMRECRGIIVRRDVLGKWICVCRGLDKFFNIQEPQADAIDWTHGITVTEKIDGSNIRLWYDQGKWHISTLGLIDAADTIYGRTFINACGTYSYWRDQLNPNYTYVFEVVGPLIHIVVRYAQPAIYFICARNMNNGIEYTSFPLNNAFIRPIPTFSFSTLDECLAARVMLGKNCEGMVVRDSHGARVKLKTDWYIHLHYLRGNGVCTIKRVINMWLQDSLDDFMASFPEYIPFIDKVMNILRHFIRCAESAYEKLSTQTFVDRKHYARAVHQEAHICQPYLFARFDNKCDNATTFFRTINVSTLIKAITPLMDEVEYGELEDE